MEYSPKKMTENLELNNFNFKKKYGQNFIIDENIINSIIEKSQIDNETLVIEIGAGAGSLTNKLVKKAKNVLCYEIDEKLKPILENNVKSDNLEIIYKDFLLCNVKEDIKKYKYNKFKILLRYKKNNGC